MTLVNAEYEKPNPIYITLGMSVDVEVYKTGLYILNHHNFSNMVNRNVWDSLFTYEDCEALHNVFRNDFTEEERDEWQAKFAKVFEIPSHGVCDSPDQFMEVFGKQLTESPNECCVSFCRVDKEDQPENGGWRWHKWGEYYGKGDPQYEYLYDEPDFTHIYCFNIFRKKH